MTKSELTRHIRQAVLAAGFDAVGIARVVRLPPAKPIAAGDARAAAASEPTSPAMDEAEASIGEAVARLDAWLAAGRAGEMDYMHRQRDARADPDRVLPGARAVVVTALNYRTEEPVAIGAGASDRREPVGYGRIARYAWGVDYHEVIRAKLAAIGDDLRRAVPGIGARGVVDSAPVMERDYARLAGLGWFGKNTLLLNQRLGSWFFLGALLVDRELDCDEPFRADHCGTCTRCLDACPTQAFDGPYQLDATKCISYQTIERKSPIPETQASQLGDWLFGCDVCQEVCPWNAKVPSAAASPFAPLPGSNPVDLAELARLDEAAFRARYRHTPLFRAKREKLQRTARLLQTKPNPPTLPLVE